jgi:hypothetical protein
MDSGLRGGSALVLLGSRHTIYATQEENKKQDKILLSNQEFTQMYIENTNLDGKYIAWMYFLTLCS